MTAREALGLWLLSWRERNNLTQLDVATECGYSTPQFVSNWERGISIPPTDCLPTLIEIYRIPKRTMLIHLEIYFHEVAKEQFREVKKALRRKT